MSRLLKVAALALVVAACGGSSPAAPGQCGDGVVDPDEACDEGAENGTDGVGCTAACAFACVDPAADCGAAPACQVAICTTDHVCVFTTDASQDGMTCGTGMVCGNGTCNSAGMCGNGVTEGSEECDFGSGNGTGTGCEEDCTFSCATSPDSCSDGNACNGVETCGSVTVNGQTGQRCLPGTGPGNGTVCGTGMICLNEACTNALCGDSFTTSPEECDDANAVTADGCENNCTFSCVSTDLMRNCTPADPCQGQGTCNDTTHRCTAGTPLADNTACGTGGYCKTGVCTQPMCGNGMVEPGETCDEGAANGTAGSGCKANCTWVCVNAATDCAAAPACQMQTCSAAHTCQPVADPSKDGMTCGTGLVCDSGACVSPTAVCGNGVTETGEQCDFGAGNGTGTGCESNCQFSCTIMPNSCDDGNACNGTEMCGAVVVNGHMGQRCTAGTPLADNTACGTSQICKMQVCVASTCGDGYVDMAIGESCEPPNTATCDPACHVKVCGDGVRAGTEQCDDGNLTNLDGCSGTCRFEQTQRANNLAIQFGTSTYCTANALGGAAGSVAQGLITDAIDMGVTTGSITLAFQFLNLDDLTGTSDNSLNLGVLGGTPVAGGTYNGNNDLDWWYTTDPTTINAQRVPTTLVPATISAKTLNAGPANMAFTVNFVGVDVTMDMFNARFRGTIGATSTPLTSTGAPPGHLAAEHLDPALVSFATIGSNQDPNQMIQYCGNVTARSLANTLVPSSVISYCSSYSISHSLLDLYIGGCRYLGFINVISATQPDTSRNGTDVYQFQANAQRFVTGCTKNGQPAVLSECLDNAGYSSFFRMTTDRIIAK